MPLSQNGWIASKDKNAIGVKNFQVPGTQRHFSCTQAVAPILINFAAEFHKQVEPIDTGTYDDWGWSVGDSVGIGAMSSNHASGTAIDINATLHPFSRSGTFNLVKLVKLHLLVRKYGIRWGGDYHSTKDEMHFEIVETPIQVRARIATMKLPMPQLSK